MYRREDREEKKSGSGSNKMGDNRCYNQRSWVHRLYRSEV